MPRSSLKSRSVLDAHTVAPRRKAVRSQTIASAFVLAAACLFGACAAGQTLPGIPAIPLTPFQQKALLAFAPGNALFSNLTLTGTVKRTAGSTSETGTVQLHASSDGTSTETWSGAGGNRVVSCTAWTGTRSCTLLLNSKTQDVAGVASQRTVPWFAPWMGVSLLSSSITGAAESTNAQGSTVLAFSPAYGSLTSLPTTTQTRLQRLIQAATVTVLFDTETSLPSGMHYSEPLSSDSSNAIDVSVVYGDYSLDQGFVVPHHIQRYLQRTLESDIHITSVSLN